MELHGNAFSVIRGHVGESTTTFAVVPDVDKSDTPSLHVARRGDLACRTDSSRWDLLIRATVRAPAAPVIASLVLLSWGDFFSVFVPARSAYTGVCSRLLLCHRGRRCSARGLEFELTSGDALSWVVVISFVCISLFW